MSTRSITRSALIAALYVALTLLLRPLSYGSIQFRLAEALTLLPILFVEAIPGLAIGCLIANIFSGYGAYDMIFGTLATLIAAMLTYLLKRNTYIAALPPVLINAIVVPFLFILGGDEGTYFVFFISIFISQAVIIYILGIPLIFGLKKVLPLEINNKQDKG